MNASLLTLIRYALTFAGGFLVSKGLVNAEQVEAIVGASLTILTTGFGIYVNAKNTSKVEAAQTVLEQTAPPVSQNEVAAAAAKVQS